MKIPYESRCNCDDSIEMERKWRQSEAWSKALAIWYKRKCDENVELKARIKELEER